MYKVLQIIGKGDMGGITSVIYNYTQFIDKEKIQLDIACTTNDKIGNYGEKFEKLGLNVYSLPFKSESYTNYKTKLTELIKKNKYDAVHCNAGPLSFTTLQIAKKNKVPQRIEHIHSTKQSDGIKGLAINKIGQTLTSYYSTNILPCGKLAAIKTLGKNYQRNKKCTVLPNSIDTKLYAFNAKTRSRLRKSLNIDNKYVLGFVGRLEIEKNPLYAVKIMENIKKQIPNSILLIIGDGSQKQKIINYIKRNHLEKNVKLTGTISNMQDYYQALDALLMPSIWEGFPCVGLEAMASGLPLLLSDSITDELSFGSKVYYLPLEKPDKWTKTIYKLHKDNLIKNREHLQTEVTDNHYDIRDSVKKLENLYLNF